MVTDLSSLPQSLKIWPILPPSLHKSLLLGAEGAPRLLRLALEHLPFLDKTRHRDLLTRVFADMILCAWESNPFDAQAASALKQVQEQTHILPPQAAFFVSHCASVSAPSPGDAKRIEKDLAARNIPALQDFLDTMRHKEPDNLYWLGLARHLGITLNASGWFENWLDFYELPEGALAMLRADWLFSREDFSGAEAQYAKAHSLMPLPGLLIRRGECLHRLKAHTDAQELWRQGLAARPWQSNLLFRLTDSLLGYDRPSALPEGQGYILLYTWNHDRDLNEAMACLAASELGGTRILLLDNGSTDDTEAVIKKWSAKLGDRLELLALPVNVGAPAARNWLLHDPRVKAADWAVFLDDDALVPRDWLGFFGTALRAFPEAGIFGCRVVEKDAPLVMQSIDLHFEVGDAGQRQANHPGNNILNGHVNEADFGQYAYMRSCVSVTGCCHLFTRRSMEATGDFDLRFSPSQFDDFERDLRSSLNGSLPLYQGHLRVQHIKRNNMITGMTPWQQANVAGNLVKLWKSYSPEQVHEIANNDLRAMEKHLQYRLKFLSS